MRLGHDLQQEQPHQHAIAFRDVAMYAHPARFLTAHDDVIGDHQVGDVVETDGRFHDGQIEFFGDAVDHARRRYAAHHAAAQPALLQQVAQDQPEYAMGIDELAARVDGADTVGIAVGRQACMTIPVLHHRSQQREVTRNRLRMNAAKARVHLITQVEDIGSCPV